MEMTKKKNRTISLSDYVQQTKGEMISQGHKKRKKEQWNSSCEVL